MSQSRQRWVEDVSRKLLIIEIDILIQKRLFEEVSNQKEVKYSERLTERSLHAITTHRSSAKYKSLVQLLQLNVNMNHIVKPVLHIDTLLTNGPNNDTEAAYHTNNFTDTNSWETMGNVARRVIWPGG